MEKLSKILNLCNPKLLCPSRALQLNEETIPLVNPHEFVKVNPIGQTAMVSGQYGYHHYMQGTDDSGWGCAYRSLQTIWSWMINQGFTDKPVPDHKAIQQCLVDIGDKEAKFVGSRQWIGSTELSFCLETLLGISSRILSTNSGSEIASHSRQLLYHFENGGGPVMIGGGQLAHTILGVDYNTRSGECRYLILDPHFTGSDIMIGVVEGGRKKRELCATECIVAAAAAATKIKLPSAAAAFGVGGGRDPTREKRGDRATRRRFGLSGGGCGDDADGYRPATAERLPILSAHRF